MARRSIPRDWDDVEEDEVDVVMRRGVRRAPARDFLDVGGLGGALRRSRSTGARPAPNVVVVDNIIDGGRSASRDRRGRRHHESDEDLVDAVEDVAREIRRNRSRTPGGLDRRDLELELMRERQRDLIDIERERERLERELDRDRLENRERTDYERQLEKTRSQIKRLKDQLDEAGRDSKRKEERELIVFERDREDRDRRDRERIMRLEIERKEREKTDEERRLLEELRSKEARRKREKDEEQDAAVSAYQRKLDDEKKKREEMRLQFKLEEEEKKRKEKEEEERWRQKLEDKKREEEEKKKKHDEEIAEEMRKKLHKFGFQDNQVDVILDPKKAPKVTSSSKEIISIGGRGPTYIKIHKNHVDVETLKYFGLPWGYDPSSTEYFLIFQEMDSKETEILFEHTRKLRKRTTELLIEDRGRKHGQQQLAFVRRRTPSASPSRGKRRESSPKRVRPLLQLR
jgi:hypothetical protein